MSAPLGGARVEGPVTIRQPTRDANGVVRMVPRDGVLACWSPISATRQRWVVRLDVPDGQPPEIAAIVVEQAADGTLQRLGGDTLDAAARLAEHVVSGRESREPVAASLMMLAVAYLALATPPAAEAAPTEVAAE